ncbi:hypothetical protein BHK69_20635 [Bosea vaviloviae]|uniref:Uncharacterized protein n=1 Tax=Bosea vaviloviae TaxID=1526658 RepID=A0A1D7U574_9HYPH|nr:hypothetical protein BHK69_20635 [Bosea vaviloviae]
MAVAQGQSVVAEDFFSNRPAFSLPEQVARMPATCETVRTQLPGTVPADARVDMAVKGPVSLIQTDGTLWYVAVCSDPGVRILCVTYSGNELKLGDQVILRGGYNRQDDRHVLLDPCLASPDRGEASGEASGED